MGELTSVIIQLGEMGLWLRTAGIIFILWIVFQATNFFINRRRMKEVYSIKADMRRMEDKLDFLIKKKNFEKR